MTLAIETVMLLATESATAITSTDERTASNSIGNNNGNSNGNSNSNGDGISR
jgi:hypothetical protein